MADALRSQARRASLKYLAERANYVDAVLELKHPAAMPLALRQVAKVCRVAETAPRTEVADKMLFGALSQADNPIVFTLHTMVLHLSVTLART